MPKTKSFRVAVEGDTVDGRVIERQWLLDAAETYHRETYGARVNMEHIRGVTAAAPFKAYGDVLSVSTSEVELTIGGKKVKKLALDAEVEATDDLVAMNANGQKIYTSIEIQPNFANSGKAYLVGLAVTDSPASLGTEVLSFALKHPGAIRTGPQPQQPGNVFSLGMETSFALADGEVATPPADSSAGLIAAATAFFTKLTKGSTPDQPAAPPTPPAGGTGAREPANDNEAQFATIAQGMEKMAAAITALGAEVRKDMATVRTEQTRLNASIENTEGPGQPRRQPATGGATAAYKRAEC